MMGEAQTLSGQVVIFGPFRLHLLQRVLQEGERPIRLGSRALEILLILVERAGELVTKDEIMARVWPNMVTEEVTLRVHLAGLRKALGHGLNGARYVENVTGRGYRFVAPVTRLGEDGLTPALSIAAGEIRYALPAPLTRMIGRSDIVGALAGRLPQQRMVTITGPGGVGKTTVALATAEKLASSYEHGACFVDLASITDPRLVPSTLASALRLEVLSDDPAPVLLAFLGGRQLLIVLDNCEHVVEAAAMLAETVLSGAAGVHILATSREPLRASGEWVHRLQPLALPPPSAMLTAAEALAFPAVELFAERAMANLDSFELGDADAAIVADLCRRLDGIPLAIELAAARVDLLGVRELAAQLEDSLQLLTNGRRTAAPRHQALRATLDWSYALLSSAERAILCRVAVFPGRFDLGSARAVAAGEDVSAAELLDGISNLVAKSLVTTDVSGDQVLFGLLDTTRTYALEQLAAGNEGNNAPRRHAEWCLAHWDAVELQAPGTADWVATYGHKVDDIRAALDWCFSSGGDACIGVKLTAASAPLWFQLSIIDEYRRNLERALQALNSTLRPDAALEMKLNATLGYALTHMVGPTVGMLAAFSRASEIADQSADSSTHWLALWGMGMARVTGGDYPTAVDFFERSRRVSLDAGDWTGNICERSLALAHHCAGNQAAARLHCEYALTHPAKMVSPPGNSLHRMDRASVTRAILARVLWVQGFPDQAVRAAHDAVEDSLSADHALSVCYAMSAACTVLLWAGDESAAAELNALLLDRSARHSLSYWDLWGRCFEAALTLRHGEGDKAFERCRALRRDPLISALHLETLGSLNEELVGVDVIARVETDRAAWCAAEILRANGELRLKEGASDAADAAEILFLRSLDIARQQDALSWELRAAISLARLWGDQGRNRAAYDRLSSVHARFTEGFGTADLITATTLLDELARSDRGAL